MNRKMIPASAFAVALLLGSVAEPVASQVPTVTLDEAMSLAMQYSPAIIQAEGDIRVAQASKRESISDWLPRVRPR